MKLAYNTILVLLFAFATLQVFNVMDIDLSPLFTYSGRSALFILVALAILSSSTSETATILLIFLVPTMLYAEHIKDVLLRKSALIVEPHQE
jgi:hypothetical protein